MVFNPHFLIILSRVFILKHCIKSDVPIKHIKILIFTLKMVFVKAILFRAYETEMWYYNVADTNEDIAE